MARMRVAIITGIVGVSVLAPLPTVAWAHDEVVREYHSYTYERDDDDDYDGDWRERRYRERYYDERPAEYRRSYYEERPRHDRHYREGRYRDDCRTSGTTGAILGGVVGALEGRGLDRYGDRTPGTLIGAGGGAVLGHEVDSKHRC